MIAYEDLFAKRTDFVQKIHLVEIVKKKKYVQFNKKIDN